MVSNLSSIGGALGRHDIMEGEGAKEAAVTGVTKMLFYEMLQPLFQEISRASMMSPEEQNNVADYLWHEVLAETLAVNDRSGIKDSIRAYITKRYVQNSEVSDD